VVFFVSIVDYMLELHPHPKGCLLGLWTGSDSLIVAARLMHDYSSSREAVDWSSTIVSKKST
jgi:hypothetical protein